jgi:hypothetical protein
MTCATPGCNRPDRVKRLRLCRRCYQRHRRHGTLRTLPTYPVPWKPRHVVHPPTDTLEDLRLLDEAHVGANEAAQRTGFPTAHAMERWLYRHGQNELWLRLEHRDPVGTHSSKRRRAS